MSATASTQKADGPSLRLDAALARPEMLWIVAAAIAAIAMATAPLSMAATWIASSTYHHTALAIPASLWLLWRGRGALNAARPSLVGAAAVAGFAALWLVARAARVNIV
ncbi:MAG: hypothetical protein K2Q06_06150, partial [Parvularculaceae bacterium]|nr:hypothetical protein [Parvularculaceae bacterium]